MENSNFTTLLSQDTIQTRIRELGMQITMDYQGQDLVVLGVLTGSFIFMADLVRQINLPVACEFMRIASYKGQASTGKIQLLMDISPEKIKNKCVLLVEDIVDTGNSIVFLKKHLQQFAPTDLKVCSLLLKKEKLRHTVEIDYLGFSIESLFVIGYGMDLDGLYRNLPAIMVNSSKE